VMRAEGLLQRHRPSVRRRRPGYFRVGRPDQLRHMDMTSVWVADHGWCYLNAIVDCCTREIPAFGLDLRCRRQEAEAVIDAAVAAHSIEPGRLTLGTDNGTAYGSGGIRASSSPGSRSSRSASSGARSSRPSTTPGRRSPPTSTPTTTGPTRAWATARRRR